MAETDQAEDSWWPGLAICAGWGALCMGVLWMPPLYHAIAGYPPGHVTRADLGSRWPLSIGQAYLHCEHRDSLVVTLASIDQTDDHSGRYELVSDPRPGDPIHAIWDERKPLRPLLVRARALCR